MDSLSKDAVSRQRGAALIIVLAFAVLLTGLTIAYLARATSDRQVAHSSFNQSRADQLVASAMDNIIGDIRKEITNGSTPTTVGSVTIYTPTSSANMLPKRSGNPAGAPDPIPNLVRISWSADSNLSIRSQASAVNSAPADPANPNRGDITLARWNEHYLIPKADTTNDKTDPIGSFTAPDWVFVTSDPTNTNAGRRVIGAPDPLVIGRYAYAIYDEGGLLDMNVAGFPTGTTAVQSGRKGSLAFADLTTLPVPIPNSSSPYQVDRLVGWRNYATTQPSNLFPATDFAANFQTSTVPATNFYNYVANDTTGFLNPSTAVWDVNANGKTLRTDQSFVQRQELIAFRKATQFSSNALQYLGTFSRETNSPSFSPSTPAGSTIDYATLANSGTATNPNFLGARATVSFTRFDGTTANIGDPLLKTRFPLSRLAWITYKGPSAEVYAANNNDPVILALLAAGVPLSTIQAGTAANIKACFGLTFTTTP